MRKTKEDRKNHLLSKIKNEAMNRRQIADVMFCAQQTADDYIAELRKEKKIYIAFWHRTVGLPSAYYMSGEGFDAHKPKTMSRSEITAKYEQRIANGESAIRPRATSINNQHLIAGCFANMVRNANMNPAVKLSD